MVGKLFASGLESDVDALQTLGRKGAARSSPGLWRVRTRAPGPAHLSRWRQRLFRWFQGHRQNLCARDRVAAHRSVSSGILSARPHGTARGDESLQGFEGPMAGSDALWDLPALVR